MAEHPHLAIVRTGYERFNAGDYAGVCAVLDPEVVWDMSGGLPDGRVYHGHAGFRQFVTDALTLWDIFELHPGEMQVAGDEVLVLGSVLLRSRGHGMTLQPRWAWTWTLAGGLGVLLRNHTRWEDARRAFAHSPSVALAAAVA